MTARDEEAAATEEDEEEEEEDNEDDEGALRRDMLYILQHWGKKGSFKTSGVLDIFVHNKHLKEKK